MIYWERVPPGAHLLTKVTAPVEISLSHPPVIMCDLKYMDEVDKVFAYPNLSAKN